MGKSLWERIFSAELFLFTIIVLTACGGGGGGSTGGGAPIGIGPNGGTITSSDGKASATIPAGALSQDTVITVAVASNPPSGNIGTAYEFGPAGTVFSQPVSIAITYDAAALPSDTNESDLKLGKLVNNQWEEVSGSTVDPTSNKVSGTTTSFSIYGVIIVNSSAGTFTLTGSMGVGRNQHTATLLPNGKVLIAGGSTGGNVFLCGGLSGFSELETSELYDPNTGVFSASGSMTTSRSNHTATLLSNGKVLIASGTTAELYDPTTGTFSATGSMTTSRKNFTATLLSNGKVLIVGGLGTSFPLDLATSELYDPATGTFSASGSMGVGRDGHKATLLSDGRVLITGGWTGNGDTIVASAELYDPNTGTFSPTGSMSTARVDHTSTLLSTGKVLVAGGHNDENLASAELYDPATGTFSAGGNMATSRMDHTATLLPGGKVLVSGGCSFNSLSATTVASAELYDPDTNTFAASGSMTSPRSNHTATLLTAGMLLVTGGHDNNTNGLASAELFQE